MWDLEENKDIVAVFGARAEKAAEPMAMETATNPTELELPAVSEEKKKKKHKKKGKVVVKEEASSDQAMTKDEPKDS